MTTTTERESRVFIIATSSDIESPLSVVMAERIGSLRGWAAGRTVQSD